LGGLVAALAGDDEQVGAVGGDAKKKGLMPWVLIDATNSSSAWESMDFRGWLGSGFRSMMGKSYNFPCLYAAVAIAILLLRLLTRGGGHFTPGARHRLLPAFREF
jgi:hypothetical protein